jgi:lipoprotein-releasing system permease protein
MLSSFTLISLIGVMLGVLVLVVVMAVYAGMERDVKGRLLGFTPHILLRHSSAGFADGPMEDWQQAAKMAATLPRVEAATAFVSDNVIIDVQSWQRPVMFRGIDTSDPAQVDGITRMLDKENHPESSADLGIDDRAVISSVLAEQLALRVGDTIRLLSTRNVEEVMRVFKTTKEPPLREASAEIWQAATSALAAAWKEEGGKSTIPVETLQTIYNQFNELHSDEVRKPEIDLLDALLSALEENEKDETAGVYVFTTQAKAGVQQAVTALENTNAKEMNSEILQGLDQLVLPKEAKVIGIYQASQMAVTPDLFIPLPLSQDLAGLGEAVQGVALRLDDAYAAEPVATSLRAELGPDWSLLTWGDQYATFFGLINQQRVMMYFALSFIVLVSAFSMMAVMFTVTIQKRREIGVMKALGATPGQIVRVFLYQGMLLGVLGSALGILLGRLVIHFRGEIQVLFRSAGFDPFAASFTGFGVLPAFNHPAEQAVIGLMAFVLCSIAALVPAFFAANSDAAKSLRNL